MAGERSGWGVDLAVGGLCGLIAGAVVVVNLVIFLGVEGGYVACEERAGGCMSSAALVPGHELRLRSTCHSLALPDRRL
jgi:hypothetical protein